MHAPYAFVVHRFFTPQTFSESQCLNDIVSKRSSTVHKNTAKITSSFKSGGGNTGEWTTCLVSLPRHGAPSHNAAFYIRLSLSNQATPEEHNKIEWEMKDKDVSVLTKEGDEDAKATKEKQQTPQNIILTTSDGVELVVERRAAEKSALIKDLIEDFGGHVYQPIPIANVDEQTMRKIIEWCEQETNNAGEWAAKFLEVDQDELFEIILAANYLDIKSLLDAACNAVANKITGKTPQDLCHLFNITDYPLPKPAAAAAAPPSSPNSILPHTHTHNPTLQDIHHARHILQHAPLHSRSRSRTRAGQQPPLPPELALLIVSLGYRPRLLRHTTEERTYRANSFWRPGPYASVAGLYLSSAPLPAPDPSTGVARIVPQRVVFRTRSADQGWADAGGRGTFWNSHTWFEASIVRPVSPETEGGAAAMGDRADHRAEAEVVGAASLGEVLPGVWETPGHARGALAEAGWDFVEGEEGSVVWKVCNNITAKDEYSDYVVEWGRGVAADAKDTEAVGKGKGFLERLDSGCVVVLWARAEQQCWENSVEQASIEIEYEVL
ncbi:ubiquitin-protein ligase [Diplodia corticola]|uniref:Ubiquitin-protein ligase n=1 Tax=Diplodia corticola TaxID=236234 RepID=A0A1J9RIK2_9PEZI|nr:ubiquitin-protein ligase [Diplodia corticola]OJD40289.1 ubiquitin-protein ligase [Diplodia corticola]